MPGNVIDTGYVEIKSRLAGDFVASTRRATGTIVRTIEGDLARSSTAQRAAAQKIALANREVSAATLRAAAAQQRLNVLRSAAVRDDARLASAQATLITAQNRVTTSQERAAAASRVTEERQVASTLRFRERIGGNLQIATSTFQGILAYKAVQQGIDLIRSSVSEAAQAQKVQERVNKVFGDSAVIVRNYGDTAYKSIGESTAAAEDAAATFGNFFSSLGLGQQQVADMSTRLTQLAGDVASFTHQDPGRVQAQFLSGLAGQSRALRPYGIDLSSAALKQEAVRLGLVSLSSSALPAAAKALAAYHLILRETSNEQGAFAKHSGDLANQQKTLGAQWTNLKERLGKDLVPAEKAAVEVGVGFLNNLSLIGNAASGKTSRDIDTLRNAMSRLKKENPIAHDSLVAQVNKALTSGDTRQLETQILRVDRALAAYRHALVLSDGSNGDFRSSTQETLAIIGGAANQAYEQATVQAHRAEAALTLARGSLAKTRAEREKALTEGRQQALAPFALGNPFDQVFPAAPNLTSQRDSVRSAVDRVGQAQGRLNQLRASGKATADQLASAEHALTRAQISEHSAASRLADAQKKADTGQGLSLKQVLSRQKATRDYQRGLASDIGTLERSHLRQSVIGQLEEEEKSAPGTIRNVVAGLNGAVVREMNRQQAGLRRAQTHLIRDTFVRPITDQRAAVASAAKLLGVTAARAYRLGLTAPEVHRAMSTGVGALLAVPGSPGNYAPGGPGSTTAGGNTIFNIYGPVGDNSGIGKAARHANRNARLTGSSRTGPR